MATEKTDVVIVGVGGPTRQGGHEGDRARARPAARDQGFCPARRTTLLPAPGPASAPQAPARDLATQYQRARDADPDPELRQPGRRRQRALWLGLVALPRG